MSFLGRFLGRREGARDGQVVPPAAQKREIPPMPPAEVTFRMLVVGAQGSGKSAVVRRYCAKSFTEVYTPTIGPELRVVQLASRSARKGDPTIFLELLEVAHQELRSPRLAGYLEDIHGAIVVFDISEQASLRAVDEWCAVLMPGRAGDKQKKKPISLLLANKTDVGPRVATETAIERFARDVGFSAWSLGSAKEGSGVKAALDRHVEAIVTANGLDRRPATGMARQHTEGLGAGEEIKYNVPSPLLPLSDVATEPNSTEGQDDDVTASGKHDEGWLDRFWSDFEGRLGAHEANSGVYQKLREEMAAQREELELLSHAGSALEVEVSAQRHREEWEALLAQLETSARIEAVMRGDATGETGLDFDALFQADWGITPSWDASVEASSRSLSECETEDPRTNNTAGSEVSLPAFDIVSAASPMQSGGERRIASELKNSIQDSASSIATSVRALSGTHALGPKR